MEPSDSRLDAWKGPLKHPGRTDERPYPEKPLASTDQMKSSEDQVIRLLLEATASKTGTDFFRALVKSLAQALGTTTAWVTEFLPAERRLQALAMWSQGRYIREYEYDIGDTPCEPVIDTCRVCHIPDRVIELFPGDPDLAPLNAVSYLGAPLVDQAGKLIGHLAALDDKPMPDTGHFLSVIELFAARAAAEYLREKAEGKLKAREEHLRRLLNAAMDAIVNLDADLVIRQINPAACEVFGCEEEDLIGESLLDFLHPSSAARFKVLAGSLAGPGASGGKLWIPDALEANRWDRTTFPAEATLSRYEIEGRIFLTLILRNIDERREAQKRIDQLYRETEYLKSAINQAAADDDMIGSCPAMRTLFDGIERVAQTDATALILGETGTGKELVARSLHRRSLRRNRPFVCVNCGAIPGSLMESEFFGHEKGAFTGATDRRKGRFESADGGTLFLDEIGELPPDLQAKLLRVLQDGEFERVGGSERIRVDVRIVAATHRDLDQMVREGTFRQDLYYRLHVFPLTIAPLRERKQDVLLLAEAFIQRLGQKMGRTFDPLSESDRAALLACSWPGNVRELQNVIERAIIQSRGKSLNLVPAMPHPPVPEKAGPAGDGPGEKATILTDAQMREFEKRNIERALAQSGGVVFGADGAAARLGLKPTTLASRIKTLGIRKP